MTSIKLKEDSSKNLHEYVEPLIIFINICNAYLNLLPPAKLPTSGTNPPM